MGLNMATRHRSLSRRYSETACFGGARARAGRRPQSAAARSVSATAAIRPTSTSTRPSTYLTQFVGAPCYSTLLRIDSRDYNRLMPDLAEKWDVSADGKTVTFHLRRGVVFHNGMPMTAEDVIYSLDRIRKPPRGIISPRKGQLGNIAGDRGAGSATPWSSV